MRGYPITKTTDRCELQKEREGAKEREREGKEKYNGQFEVSLELRIENM